MYKAAIVLTVFLVMLTACSSDELVGPTPPVEPSGGNLVGEAWLTPGDFSGADAERFAPPWDVVGSEDVLMLYSHPEEPAADEDVVITAEPGDSRFHLVYDTLWLYNGVRDAWSSYSFDATAVTPHTDYPRFLTDRFVQARIPADALGDGENYVLAYICSGTLAMDDGRSTYACGCADEDVDTCGRWNIQRVEVVTETCGDGVCAGDENVYTCAEDCLVGPEAPEDPSVDLPEDPVAPEKCVAEAPFSCMGWRVTTYGTVDFLLMNDGENTVSFDRAVHQNEICVPTSLSLEPGASEWITCFGEALEAELQEIPIEIAYTPAGHTFRQVSQVRITTTPERPALLAPASIVEFSMGFGEQTDGIRDILVVGQTKEYTLQGEPFETTPILIADRIVKFLINGEVTDSLAPGESEQIAGATVLVHEVIEPQPYVAEICLGDAWEGCQVWDTLAIGETKEYVVDGADVEVTLLITDGEQAKFLVNGAVTDSLAPGERENVGLHMIEVQEILVLTEYQ